MKKTTSAGMTLIEILIVVAIIIVIMTALMVNILPTLAKGRDGKRKADLQRIAKALEEYYNDKGGYPTSLDACGRGTLLATYLPDVPCDPVTKEKYLYYVDSNDGCGVTCRSYTLYTVLDKKNDPDIQRLGCALPSPNDGCVKVSGVTYNYGVSSSNRSVKR